ncbi:MAG TPA: DUF1801 domain-containing protein [Polyangiaceae bacterium]|nr:DUF1801 domain-containing protein [Polyangiaceae bacterium]
MPFDVKNPASASDYLASLPSDRKQAIAAVRSVIKKHLPKGYVETTQYGMISYVVPLSTYPDGYLGKKDVPLPYICLASQKHHMAVYLMCVYDDAELSQWFTTAWKKSGKKLDMGKSCLRFKSVDDLALNVLGEAIGRVSVKDYITLYARKRGARGPAEKQAPAKKAAPTKVPGKKTAGRKTAR